MAGVPTPDVAPPWTGEVAAPLNLWQGEVIEAWIDEYAHVNIAHYLTICDQANWAFWTWINDPEQTIEARAGAEYVIVENHVHYVDELALGEAIHVTTELLEHDDKRFILFHRVWKTATGGLSATNEVKVLGFDLAARRPMAWRERVAARLVQVRNAHAGLPRPDQAGLGIALKRR